MLADDELSVDLVRALGEATRAATDLMSRAATAAAPPQQPEGGPAAAPVQSEPQPGFDRAMAEEQLRTLQRRLHEIGLELTWHIGELGDAHR